MGLDNYVDLVSRKKIEDIPSWVELRGVPFESDDGHYIYELSYFRKCWHIHDIMMGLDNSEDCRSWDGEYTDLAKYRDGLINIFSDPCEFNDRSQVFTVNEELGAIGQSILNCNWAIDYLVENHDAYVRFVDSY